MNEQQIQPTNIVQHAKKIPISRRIFWGFIGILVGGFIGLISGITNGQSEYDAIIGMGIGCVIGVGILPESIDEFNQVITLPEWMRHRIRPSMRASVEGEESEYEESEEEETLSFESPPPHSTQTAILADPLDDLRKTSVLTPPVEDTGAAAAPFSDTEEASLFSETVTSNPLPFRRLTLDEILEHSGKNDYRVVIGRSLTDKRAKFMDFFMRHFKCVGTTQYGKSTFAAYLLWLISHTHDSEHVQFAILDLENRTGKIFNDDPHVASFLHNGKLTKLHARSIKEVVEHLGYLYELMNYRYSLSLEEQEKQPLIIIYVEEFLRLKNELKKAWKTSAVGSAAEQEAKFYYLSFMHRFTGLAAQGLKIHMQFLVCAQVEYRDEDLLEAFNQLTSGVAFCVKPSAAQAAGFYQNEKLAANARAKVKGQGVFEIPEFADILLVPEFDVNTRIRAIEDAENARKTTSFLFEFNDDSENVSSVPAYPMIVSATGGGQVKILESQQQQQMPKYIHPIAAGIDQDRLDRALRAYDQGYTTQAAMAMAMGNGETQWTVRDVHSAVTRIRQQKAEA